MDIGSGDVATPSPIELDYPTLLESLPAVNILVYSLETVIAEKLPATVNLADQSSRRKDYHDLYHLLAKEKLGNHLMPSSGFTEVGDDVVRNMSWTLPWVLINWMLMPGLPFLTGLTWSGSLNDTLACK